MESRQSKLKLKKAWCFIQRGIYCFQRSFFNDPLSVTFPDLDHSFGEERYVIIGLSNANRILVDPHADRADRVRIISPREATRNERRFYEDGE
jgi:uncharacterized DUF497 family protein